MRRCQFISLLARPKSSCRQDAPVQHRERVHLIVELSAMAFNNACRTCHMVKEGDNRLGPNLHKIIGRKAGSLPDYNYSGAMKEAGFVWDKEKLDPDEIVPGNSMKPYSGLASSDDRTKIIAFVAQSQ